MSARSRIRDRSRPGGGAWTPLALGSALELWLEADRGMTAPGNAISQWSDQSPKARHMLQVTPAAQPTLDPTGGPLGGPAVVVDLSHYLYGTGAPANWAFLHQSTLSLFVVYKTLVADPNNVIAFLGTAFDGLSENGAYFALDDRTSASRNDNAIVVVTQGGAYTYGYVTGNGTFPQQSWDCASFFTTPTTHTTKRGGVTRGSASVGGSFPTSNTYPATLGRISLTTASGAPCAITAVIATSSQLTATEYGRLGTYLSQKYGVTA